MRKADEYRAKLRLLDDWDAWLQEESGLPGPRANLELVQAVAEEGAESLFTRWASLDAEGAPANSRAEFLALCGVVGLGRLAAEGQTQYLEILRAHAGDPRWRVREGVAMALQRFGEADMGALLDALEDWTRGSRWEQRAAAAAVAEPRLLRDKTHIVRALHLLDVVTDRLQRTVERRNDSFRALRQGLAYCWSVVVASYPEEGKKIMEKWSQSEDKDVRWIMKENLRKKRLTRMDPEWVDRWLSVFGSTR